MARMLAIALVRTSVELAILAASTVALGAPPPELRVSAEESTCPSSGSIVTLLKRLLPRTNVIADGSPTNRDDVAVFDQGLQYRVTVAGQERIFLDAARGCSERAQHAAVFIVLVLDPPTIADPALAPVSLPPTPPSAAPTEFEPSPAASTRTADRRVSEITLGGVAQVAPEDGSRRTTFAGGVNLWIRGKRGFHLGFGAGLLHGALHFDRADADAWWIPIDFAAGLTSKVGLFEFGGEIGPSASILSIVGKNVPEARRQLRLEIGGRVSALSRFWLNQKVALFLSTDAVVRPLPYALRVDPEGEVGQMPALWLGAVAGVSAVLD